MHRMQAVVNNQQCQQKLKSCHGVKDQDRGAN